MFFSREIFEKQTPTEVSNLERECESSRQCATSEKRCDERVWSQTKAIVQSNRAVSYLCISICSMYIVKYHCVAALIFQMTHLRRLPEKWNEKWMSNLVISARHFAEESYFWITFLRCSRIYFHGVICDACSFVATTTGWQENTSASTFYMQILTSKIWVCADYYGKQAKLIWKSFSKICIHFRFIIFSEDILATQWLHGSTEFLEWNIDKPILMYFRTLNSNSRPKKFGFT